MNTHVRGNKRNRDRMRLSVMMISKCSSSSLCLISRSFDAFVHSLKPDIVMYTHW